MYKYFYLILGICVVLIDGFVVILVMFVFDIELGLYVFVGLFVISKIIDLV